MVSTDKDAQVFWLSEAQADMLASERDSPAFFGGAWLGMPLDGEPVLSPQTLALVFLLAAMVANI